MELGNYRFNRFIIYSRITLIYYHLLYDFTPVLVWNDKICWEFHKKNYFYTHLFVDYRKIIQYYQYSQSILPWSKLIKFQKYGLPFTLIIIITLNLIINRYSSKINSLYVTPKQTIEKVPIKKQLIIIVANTIITNTRTYIYTRKVSTWRSFNVRLRSVKEPTDTRSRSKMELHGTVTFQLPLGCGGSSPSSQWRNSPKPICGICLSPRLWASLSRS